MAIAHAKSINRPRAKVDDRDATTLDRSAESVAVGSAIHSFEHFALAAGFSLVDGGRTRAFAIGKDRF
jgi:hypothetical protein